MYMLANAYYKLCGMKYSGGIIINYLLGTHPDDHMYDIHLHKEQNVFLFWVSVADYKVIVNLQLPCVHSKAVITTEVVLDNQLTSVMTFHLLYMYGTCYLCHWYCWTMIVTICMKVNHHHVSWCLLKWLSRLLWYVIAFSGLVDGLEVIVCIIADAYQPVQIEGANAYFITSYLKLVVYF